MNKFDNIKNLINSLRSISIDYPFSTNNFIEQVKEKQKQIDQYKDSDFEEYFLSVISICSENKEIDSDEFYKRRKNYYKKNYLKSDTRREQLLKDEISEKWRKDSSLYRNAKSQVGISKSINNNELNKLISKRIVEQYPLRNLIFAKDKISNLINFESQTKESIIIETIFNRLNKISTESTENLNNKSIVSFIDLFKDEKNYKDVIKLLTDENFIVNNSEEGFRWKGLIDDPSLQPLKLLCTLAVVLDMKNYLKGNLKKNKVALTLTNAFLDFNVSPKYFGKVDKEIRGRLTNSKDADYYNSYHFIPHL